MSRSHSAWALVPAFVVASLGPDHASAAPSYGVAIGALVDDQSSRNFDLDATFDPNEHWTLSAGFGQSDSSSDLSDLTGTSFRAGFDAHGERFGFGASFEQWEDSGSFTSQTLHARASLRAGDFEFGLVGADRSFDVDYTITLPNRSVDRTFSVDGTGFGADLSYDTERWGLYASAVFYDYGDRFDQLVTLAQSGQVTRFPRVTALVGSLLTQAQGPLDHELGAGVSHQFQRTSLSLDWTGIEDAISGATGDSVSATFGWTATPRMSLEFTAGVSSVQGFEDTTFGGVAFLLRN